MSTASPRSVTVAVERSRATATQRAHKQKSSQLVFSSRHALGVVSPVCLALFARRRRAAPAAAARTERLFPGRTAMRVLAKTAVSCSVLTLPGNWVNMFLRRTLDGQAPTAAVASCCADFAEVW
jgi:hypothetical protein